MIRLTFAISLRQGAFTLDLQDDATVEVLGVFGPSGSGKTSLLEVIAGLRTPDRGLVRIADHTLLDSAAGVNVPVQHREVGYVPQDVALFPHLDVQGEPSVRDKAEGEWQPADRQPADRQPGPAARPVRQPRRRLATPASPPGLAGLPSRSRNTSATRWRLRTSSIARCAICPAASVSAWPSGGR